MPHEFYKVLSPRDLDAIMAYLRSVPAVRNELRVPIYKGPLRVALIPGADQPMAGEGLKDPVQRGFYLANLAHCMACHARRPDGTHDLVCGLGRGGHLMKGPWGAAVVSNIASHPTSGIDAWSDSEIQRALTQGVSRDGRELKTPMARAAYFSRMTPADLNAIVAYLRTLPPLE